MHHLNLGLSLKCSRSRGPCTDWLETFLSSSVLTCVMIHQMASSWMCGSVWSVTSWAPLSSSGSMRHLSPSPIGTHTNQSNPLSILAVSSMLERYIHVLPFVSSLFVSDLCCTLPRLCLKFVFMRPWKSNLYPFFTVSWLADWELLTEATFHVPEKRRGQGIIVTDWMSLGGCEYCLNGVTF